MVDSTDNLTTAVAAWLTATLPSLGPDQMRAWEAMLAGRCDVRVVVRLREGTIVIDAVDDAQGRYTEIYREHVHPLRPDSGFAMPETDTRQ
jgi:hypothetical protein